MTQTGTFTCSDMQSTFNDVLLYYFTTHPSLDTKALLAYTATPQVVYLWHVLYNCNGWASIFVACIHTTALTSRQTLQTYKHIHTYTLQYSSTVLVLVWGSLPVIMLTHLKIYPENANILLLYISWKLGSRWGLKVLNNVPIKTNYDLLKPTKFTHSRKIVQ